MTEYIKYEKGHGTIVKDSSVLELSRRLIMLKKAKEDLINNFGKFYLAIVILYVVVLVPLTTVAQEKNWNSMNTVVCVLKCILLSISVLGIIIFGVEMISRLIKKQISIKRKCDDKIFDKLDCYLKSRQSHSNIEYIKILNYYYSDNGPIVNVIIKNQEIDRLYKRKDFLEKKINSWDSVINNVLSILNGIILGFITMGWQTTSVDNIDWEGFGFTLSVYIVLILTSFLGIISSMRGHFDSYEHYISQYELERLEDRILELERSIIFEDKEIAYICETKNFILAFLRNEYRKCITEKSMNVLRKQMDQLDNAEFKDLFPQTYKIKEFKNDPRLRYCICDEYKSKYESHEIDDKDGYYLIYMNIRKYEKDLKRFYKKYLSVQNK